MEITLQNILEPQHLSEEAWRMRRAAHEEALKPFLDAHLERKHHGRAHPVHDFLFEYYTFRPAQLLRWTPGMHVYLAGDADAWTAHKHFEQGELGVGLYPEVFPEGRRRAAKWMLNLLQATAGRVPFLGCMGLHEWAMVFNERDIRHAKFPLRLPHDELVRFVEGSQICCSHFDAFRFFSKEALALNRLQPKGDTREQFEQPGCLHANMDLYKWAYKLFPWICSETIAEAFWLAVEAREIDMRASPYDVRGLGYDPIRIETPEGQRVYTEYQQQIWKRGQPVRARLIGEIQRLLALTAPESAGE